MAALIKAFLSIYGHCNDCCHIIQNYNDGEVLQRWYPNFVKQLSKLPEFTDVKPRSIIQRSIVHSRATHP